MTYYAETAARQPGPLAEMARQSLLSILHSMAAGSSSIPQRRAPRCKAEARAGTIEVEINGVTVRVGCGTDAKTLMAVLRALKAGA
jgi:hypothetical protein